MSRFLQSILVIGAPKKRHTIPYAMEKRDGSTRCPKCHRAVVTNGRGGWKHVDPR